VYEKTVGGKPRWVIPSREILEEIYGQHKKGLMVLALAVTHSRCEAEDAIHDAFLRLVNAGGGACGDPVAYVYGAVRHAAIDRVRRRRGEVAVSSSLAACLDGCDHAETKERDAGLAAALDTLCEEQRTVVLLRVYGGLTFRQIGEVERVPLPTVASRYTAALERLELLLRKWL
jgi:RNA polymerase sigma-70 factor, ECF subfamily